VTLIAQFLVVALRPATAPTAAVKATTNSSNATNNNNNSNNNNNNTTNIQRFEPFVDAAYPTTSVGVQVERVERFCFPDADAFTIDNNTNSTTTAIASPAAAPNTPSTPSGKKQRDVSFTFVLTDGDGRKCFGFCRRFQPPGGARPVSLALLTTRAWFSVFVPLLERLEGAFVSGGVPAVAAVVDYLNMKDISGASDRQQRFVTHIVPMIDGSFFELRAPRVSDNALDDVPYITLFRTLFVSHVLAVFEALLFERRVIFVSKDYLRLSHCIFAAASLLFPFQWQHIFIPILPRALLDVCCAPMPFVVGVHVSCMPQLQRMPLESTVFVDLDRNTVTDTAASAVNAVPDGGAAADADDAAGAGAATDTRLPTRHLERLRAELDAIVRSKRDDRHALANPFMAFFVSIFFNYAHYIVVNVSGQRRSNVSNVRIEGEAATRKHMFAVQRFIRHHPSRSSGQFLSSFCQCQMFEQFIDERLEQLESAEQVSSQFDTACDAYAAQHGHSGEDNYAAVKKQVASAGERLIATWRNTQKRWSPSPLEATPSPRAAAPPTPVHGSRAAAAAGGAGASIARSESHDDSQSVDDDNASESSDAATLDDHAQFQTPVTNRSMSVASVAPTPQPVKQALLIDLFDDAPSTPASSIARSESAPVPTPTGRAAPLFDLDDIGGVVAAPGAARQQQSFVGSPNLLDVELLGAVQPFARSRRRGSGQFSPPMSGAANLLDFDAFGAPPTPTAASTSNTATSNTLAPPQAKKQASLLDIDF
jgi:hypothetical protein